ncbi:TPA: hypothetical protein DDZ86_00345 [Candidatus Dependentiae bacterium]|nr:MAG: Outer membrane autotransporter barrel domain protein [candidate division TM6 bacterium GW2011_GWF2_43_87]HBL98078.1 hypothetical protein [Candidatus Dependentiae bacterium]
MFAFLMLIAAVFCIGCEQLLGMTPVAVPTQPIGILVRTWTPTGPLPFPVQPPPPFHPFPLPTTSMEELNYICAQWDSEEIPATEPFDDHYTATEIILTQPQHFVRLLGLPQSSPNGAWIMRSEYVRGKTPAELRDIFALPAPPVDINNVEMPASPDPITGLNYVLWTGIAGPIRAPGYDWGDGGAVQNRLVADFGTHYFPTYGYTSSSTRNHRQPIGDIALSYRPMAGGGNNYRVATYLDAFIPVAYSDLENVYHDLDYINYVNFGSTPIRDALYQISPERFDALSTLHTRSAALFSTSVLERQVSRQWNGDNCPCCHTNGFTVYGIGESDKKSGCAYCNPFCSQTFGVVGNIEARNLCTHPDFSVGFSVAGMGTDLDWKGFSGQVRGGAAQAALYAEYSKDHFFIDGLVGGGVTWNKTRRPIVFYGVDRVATGCQKGGMVELCLQGGVKCHAPLMPLARISYIFARQNHFGERGADSLNWCINSFNAHTLRTYLGFEACESFEVGSVTVLPHIEIAWVEDIPLNHRPIGARLADRSDCLTVCGAHKAHGYFIGGAGLAAEFESCGRVFIRYDAEVRPCQTIQTAKLGFDATF